MTTTTNTTNSTMLNNIEAKVGPNPTVDEVKVAVTGIVEEANKLILIDDNMPALIEGMVRSYFVERGLVPSMPAGHRCHGGEFTECACPRL